MTIVLPFCLNMSIFGKYWTCFGGKKVLTKIFFHRKQIFGMECNSENNAAVSSPKVEEVREVVGAEVTHQPPFIVTNDQTSSAGNKQVLYKLKSQLHHLHYFCKNILFLYWY